MGLMDFIKKQFIDILQWTESRRRRARLALPDGRQRNPVRRVAHRARVADGGVRQRRQGGRRVRPRHVQADDADAAGAHLPEELGQAVREPVQERRLLLQHAPAGRPALGHAAAGDDPRQGLRRRAAARVRQLRLPHRRPEEVPHRDLGHARHLHGGRPRRPAARPDAAAHQRRGGGHRASPSSTWRPTRSSSPSRSRPPPRRASRRSA